MNPILRNVLAVIAGVIIGGIVNGGLVSIGGKVVSPPPGADFTTEDGLKVAMPLMESRHFVFPFLAHAIGTLVGAFVAAKIAATRKMDIATIVGLIFLMGGTFMVFVLSSPMWFNALDLIVAYIPMAFLGGKLAIKK